MLNVTLRPAWSGDEFRRTVPDGNGGGVLLQFGKSIATKVSDDQLVALRDDLKIALAIAEILERKGKKTLVVADEAATEEFLDFLESNPKRESKAVEVKSERKPPRGKKSEARSEVR